MLVFKFFVLMVVDNKYWGGYGDYGVAWGWVLFGFFLFFWWL